MAIFFSHFWNNQSHVRIIVSSVGKFIIYMEELFNVHMYVATGEFSGQNVENSSFKRKGRLDNTHGFVKQISSDFKIWKTEKREDSSLQ